MDAIISTSIIVITLMIICFAISARISMIEDKVNRLEESLKKKGIHKCAGRLTDELFADYKANEIEVLSTSNLTTSTTTQSDLCRHYVDVSPSVFQMIAADECHCVLCTDKHISEGDIIYLQEMHTNGYYSGNRLTRKVSHIIIDEKWHGLYILVW